MQTRLKLMEATVDCLVEHGWAGTTTVQVAERAGVSRGAQSHHFRTRGELVAAAIEHVAALSEQDMLTRADAALDGATDRTTAVVTFITDYFVSPLFIAALELWVAARTDPELRPLVLDLQARIGRGSHRIAVSLLGADETRPGIREAVQATLDLARGLALANLLGDDRKRRGRIVRQWAAMLHTALRAATEPGSGNG
jgi:AcrR family transcriptional regulator